MPIRPIDLQTIAALTKEVERIQSALQQRPLSQQQQFAAQFKHETDNRQTQVTAPPKSEKTEIPKDKEGARKERERQRAEMEMKEKQEQKHFIDDDEDHNIDVRI